LTVIQKADSRWRVLLVEDDEQLARTIAESLERRAISSADEYAHVECVTDFDEALTRIEDRRYDAIILDIRDQDAAAKEAALATDDGSGDEALPADKGLTVFTEIRERRFLPIIFYSAVAHLAEDEHNPPFVTVISKLTEEVSVLRQKVVEVFDSELPQLNRSFAQLIDQVFRDFMIGFVEKRWKELSGSEHRGDLAYLLVRRLARSLDSTYIPDMAGVHVASTGTTVHPTRLYIMPALDEWRTGDLAYDEHGGGWFLVLTPTCDLIARNGAPKAKYVTLALCQLLTETDEYKAWQESGRPNISGKLSELIHNHRQPDRFYFLPAVWGMPDLVVDLQQLVSIKFEDFKNFKHVATLDDPYAQSITAQLGRYAGRVGTPDLDVAMVKSRLEQTSGENAPESENAAPTA
jgi:CheY-like chemotaxis protein